MTLFSSRFLVLFALSHVRPKKGTPLTRSTDFLVFHSINGKIWGFTLDNFGCLAKSSPPPLPENTIFYFIVTNRLNLRHTRNFDFRKGRSKTMFLGWFCHFKNCKAQVGTPTVAGATAHLDIKQIHNLLKQIHTIFWSFSSMSNRSTIY